MQKKIKFSKIGSFCAVFDESIGLCEIDQFVDTFRQQADKKDEFVIDLDVTKTMCWRIFLVKHNKTTYH